MASGIAIDDEVITYNLDLKMRKTVCSETDRLKFVILRVSSDGKSIIVDKENSLRVKDVHDEKDVFKKVMNTLPKKECRFAIYDCSYETIESRKEDLILIMWVPEDAPLKSKMIYASSNNTLKQKLTGIKLEWQINDIAEAKDPSCLIEKLGGTRVKCFEALNWIIIERQLGHCW
ncbi:cofilin-2-like [Arapaima gigas]